MVLPGLKSYRIFKCAVKLFFNQGFRAQRFQIIRIVVTGAQHEASQHNPSFHLRTEALGTALLIHIVESFVLFGTETVFHTVESFQVGACLGGCNDVVSRNRIINEVEIEILYFCSACLQDIGSL